jgi:hypothetical protein
MNPLLEWLVTSDEPWTRYRTLVELFDLPESDAEVRRARAEMLSHPLLPGLIDEVRGWPGYPLARHNDAGHPIHKLGMLIDFGLIGSDPGVAETLTAIGAHPSAQGNLQTMIHMEWDAAATRGDFWTWMACDAPLLLHAMIGLSGREHQAVAPALDHLLRLGSENGWQCVVAPELGKFRGPGRKGDPCPIATVYALQALTLCPDLLDHPAAHAGVSTLLSHWEHRHERKYYLFGMGTDFGKLKYPLVWYDLLHVVDVLSHFPSARADARFREMVAAIEVLADTAGNFTAGSMYQAWKGWSFADKKKPSPWLTFRVQWTLQRARQGVDLDILRI